MNYTPITQKALMSHEASNDNPYTRGIAQFVSGLSYDAIPAEVKARIKLLMLDALGCALYGADLEWSKMLQHTLTRVDDSRRCNVWGTALKLSAPHAALVNGTQVQGFELDDVHRDDAITRLGAKYRHKVRVEVFLNDGTRMERTVESARGSEYKFASEADIVDKFEKLALKALPQSQVEQLRDAMLGLDKLDDATRIAQLLGKR